MNNQCMRGIAMKSMQKVVQVKFQVVLFLNASASHNDIDIEVLKVEFFHQ